jgi:hypothetical protein
VDSVLKNHKNLNHLHETLINNIGMLDEDLVKEQTVKASLHLLNNVTSIELLKEKVAKITPTDSSFPHSIRLNMTLTCSEKGTYETEAFTALK